MTDLNQGEMLRNNINRKLFDDHIWLSVGVRKTKSHFTRLQRLSVCLSLLFMTMISNAMWYKSDTSGTNSQAVTFGPVTFTIYELYTSFMSSLLVVPPLLIITLFFTKSKLYRKKVHKTQRRAKRKQEIPPIDNEEQEGKNSLNLIHSTSTPVIFALSVLSVISVILVIFSVSVIYVIFVISVISVVSVKSMTFLMSVSDVDDDPDRTFPWWCIIIAWILVALSVAGAAFFTILYSLQWGKEISTAWLTAFLLSFVQSVILVQPIKVINAISVPQEMMSMQATI